MQINVIILAAGKGVRIGRPKWELPCQGGTFLSTLLEKLEKMPFKKIICVSNEESIPHDNRVNIVINHRSERGMISSIFCGIQSDIKVDGYLILPVDHPFIKSDTIMQLYDAFSQSLNAVVRPKFRDCIGHPIIIPKALAMQITDQALAGGLRAFFQLHQVDFLDIEVEDEGILRNVNYLKDLEENNETSYL